MATSVTTTWPMLLYLPTAVVKDEGAPFDALIFRESESEVKGSATLQQRGAVTCVADIPPCSPWAAPETCWQARSVDDRHSNRSAETCSIRTHDSQVCIPCTRRISLYVAEQERIANTSLGWCMSRTSAPRGCDPPLASATSIALHGRNFTA